MSNQNHPWCRDVSRDEAIRAAEDAAAAERTPLPDHRDLPSVVHDLRRRLEGLEAVADHWRRQCEADADAEKREAAPASRAGVNADGLRTERVTLEITQRAESYASCHDLDWQRMLRQTPGGLFPGESVRVVHDADAASDEAIAHGATLNALAEARESLAAANRGIARLTAELDASKEECERLRATVARLERRYLRCVDLRDADGDTIAALKARVAELEAAAAPAANAGVESKQEPVAWVATKPGDDGGYQRCLGWDRHKVIHGIDLEASSHPVSVSPLYAAPQPPRGWLTEEERRTLGIVVTALRAAEVVAQSDKSRSVLTKQANDVDAILARSTPPRVKVPDFVVGGYRNRDEAWIAAIRAAGGEVAQ